MTTSKTVKATEAQVKVAKEFDVKAHTHAFGEALNNALTSVFKSDAKDVIYVDGELKKLSAIGYHVVNQPNIYNADRLVAKAKSIVAELVEHQALTVHGEDAVNVVVGKFTAFASNITNAVNQEEPAMTTTTTAKPVTKSTTAKAAVKPVQPKKVERAEKPVVKAAAKATAPIVEEKVVTDSLKEQLDLLTPAQRAEFDAMIAEATATMQTPEQRVLFESMINNMLITLLGNATMTNTATAATAQTVAAEEVVDVKSTPNRDAIIADLFKQATKFFERLELATIGSSTKIKSKALGINSEKNEYIPSPELLMAAVVENPVELGTVMYKIYSVVHDKKLGKTVRRVLEITAGDTNYEVFDKKAVKLAKRLLVAETAETREEIVKNSNESKALKVTIMKPVYRTVDDILDAGKTLIKAGFKGITTLPKKTVRQEMRTINNNYKNANGGFFKVLTTW
jgi:hypothetical protein